MRCRKDYRELTSVEKIRYVQALYHVKSAGVIDAYADEHAEHFNHGIHRNSHFLPWHRDFVRRFEDELRAFHPAICIPYWDSTTDTSTSSPLWDNSFFGQFDGAWNLDRALGADTLPTPQDVQTALGHTTYDAFWPDLETNVHNPPHRWVAGEMGGLASPHDPVFFLHHCWIDLLWAQWQLLHPAAPFVASEPGRGLNDLMHGTTRTPADVIDHRTINIYHYPPGFEQDAPRITLPVPSVTFLDVPEGETRLGAAVFDLDACELLTLSIVNGPTLTSGPPATVFAVQAAPVVVNPETDAKGRVWFTYKGTAEGDAATGTVTIQCDQTGEQFAVMLTANTIRRPTAAIVMLLDQSNSMTFDSGLGAGIQRQDVLKFSAPTAVIALEDEHAMGVCTFDHDAHPVLNVTPAAGAGKFTINGAIAGYAPNTNGWTAIGEGLAFAKDLLTPVTGYDVKAIVVLTDGQENHGPHARRYIADVTDTINAMNGRVFAIGLGRPEVLNAAALQALCSGNNGYMAMTGDLTPDATFRLAKYYQQIFAGVTNNEIVLDPENYLPVGQEHRIPFWINEADITAKVILLTPTPYVIQWVLESPQGDIIDPAVAGPHPMAAFEAGQMVSLYRVGLPIPLSSDSAHAGLWHARLKIDRVAFKRYLASKRDDPAFAATAAHGLLYNFNVHAYSNLRLRTTLTQSRHEPGATIKIRAVLTEYGVPVERRAQCLTEITRPDNSGASVGMAETEPGIFELDATASLPGVYRFRIVASGKTLRGRPFTREQTLTGAVWRGGDRPPPSGGLDRGDHECWRELIDCLMQQEGVMGAIRRLGIDINAVRRCLKEHCAKQAASPIATTVDLASRLRATLKDDQLVQTLVTALDRQAKGKAQ